MALVGLPSIPTIILNEWGRIVPFQDKTVDRFINEFSTSCPSNDRIERIIQARNNTISLLQQINNIANTIENVINSIETLISVITRGIQTLLILPAPAQFATIGNILTLGDILDGLNTEIEKYNQTLDNIRNVIELVQTTTQSVIDKLRLLDIKIAECSNDFTPIELKNIIDVQRIVQRQFDQPIYYNNYKIEIRNDTNNTLNVPLRYAVALNNLNAIVIRGESSYSSDTQVLIDEIKQKIDSL